MNCDPSVVLMALFLSSCVALASAPFAAGAQDCATADGITEQIRRGVPDAEIRLVDGPTAERLRAGISGLIGQDVPEGGSYLIARSPSSLTVYVVRFADGCATH